MDEILIEDKKYISSKQAAKITGYAKDYIGQLCREGRVSARLVGRSWYVLETAIQDHRFGAAKDIHLAQTREETENKNDPTTWESPEYEAVTDENLPLISKAPQRIQNSWQAWFEHIADESIKTQDIETNATDSDVEDVQRQEMPESEKITKDIEEETEVAVPINTIYDLPPKDLLPHRSTDTFERVERHDGTEVVVAQQNIFPASRLKHMNIRWVLMFSKFIGVSLALLTSCLAVLGSGYFDDFIISVSQANVISGITIYIK